MPHPKHLFHFARQKCDNISAVNMLHQMSIWVVVVALVRSRPGKPNQRKGQNERFMNFAHFCEFWCFFWGKQARFTLNFCSGMPLGKVHELTFLWFGLPGPLLNLLEKCPIMPILSLSRTQKTVPVHRVFFWRGVLRDYLLRRRWKKINFDNILRDYLLRRRWNKINFDNNIYVRDLFWLECNPELQGSNLLFQTEPMSRKAEPSSQTGPCHCTTACPMPLT